MDIKKIRDKIKNHMGGDKLLNKEIAMAREKRDKARTWVNKTSRDKTIRGWDKILSDWNDFFDNFLGVTNCNFMCEWVDFGNVLVPRAYIYRNFDAYFYCCYGFGRFPDYLYDYFHSSKNCPDGSNSAGLNDSELDELLELELELLISVELLVELELELELLISVELELELVESELVLYSSSSKELII